MKPTPQATRCRRRESGKLRFETDCALVLGRIMIALKPQTSQAYAIGQQLLKAPRRHTQASTVPRPTNRPASVALHSISPIKAMKDVAAPFSNHPQASTILKPRTEW